MVLGSVSFLFFLKFFFFGSELQKKTADVSFTDLTGVIVTWEKKVTGQRMLIIDGIIEGGSIE